MKTAFFIVCFISMCQVMAQLPQLKVNVGHTRDVTCLAYSSNGKYLVSGSDDQMIKLWDVSSGKELKTFVGHTYNIRSLDISKNNKWIVSSTDLFGEIRIWDVDSGKELKSIKKTGGVCSVSFSNDGKFFVSANNGSSVSIWETATGTELKSFSGHDNVVSSAKFSADDRYIVSGANDNTIIIWEVASGIQIKTFSGNSGWISAVDFSPNGQQIVSGSRDNMVKVWDVASGNELKRFYGHYNWIRSVCFSPDGKKILSASWDRTIKLWDVGTGEEIRSFNGHSGLVNSACFSPDGKFIASGSADKSIKIWDANTGDVIKTMVGNSNYPASAAFSPDGKSVVSGGIDNTVKIWDLISGEGIKIIDAHKDYITSVCYSPDGKIIASGSYDNTLKLWDANSGSELKTLSGHVGWIKSLQFSPDGRKIVSASYDKTMKLWDVFTGSELRTFAGHTCEVNSANFSPDGNFIVSGSSLFESAIKLWDVNSGNLIKTFPHAGINVSSVCFSPDGKTIASGVWDTYIKLWDVATGNEMKRFSGYDGNMVCVNFSPDGKYLISGGYDNTVRIWDIASGKELKTLAGHSSIVRTVSYSKDGKYILSCSSDCSIRIWDAKSYNNLLSLYSVENKEWVAVTPDGRFDGTEKGIKFLYYIKGTEVIPLESSFEQFYTPGLIAQVMSGADETKPVAEFSQMLLPPEVKILSPENNFSATSGEIVVSIQANDKGGGIDEIRLYHNDKLVDGTQRGFKMAGQNKTFTIFLTDGENRIKATAFSSQRIESIPQEIMVNYQASRQVKPNMYVLAIGINNYLNPKYCLNYAKNDAEAFAQSIKKGADPIFKKVDVFFISDADATRIGIMAAIEKIKTNAKAEDVFVFYYAGHGVMSAGSEAEKSLFYLVPSDVTKMYEADEMLKKLGISANEIGEFSKTIKAQKQLFVIDACQSGGAMQTLAMRGAAEEKAIAQLARSTGTYFIAASGTEQFATEVAELGHGVFTYAVIEALKGSCKSQDGKITVNLLKSCVEDLVPELSKKHKGQPQFPTGYGFGMDFPVVMVK